MDEVLTILQPGTLGYDEGLNLQESLRERVLAAEGGEAYLVLLEHPPVITIGRSGGRENLRVSPETLAEQGIQLRETGRGGDVTYHGPGQLVGYPVLHLKHHGRGPDVHRYLRDLEQAIIDMLAEFGIVGRRTAGLTGVWTDRGKVAAIGVAIRRWGTMHGFAVNVSPRMEHFDLIVPCGIAERTVTSMAHLLDRPISVEETVEPTVRCFARAFGFESTEVKGFTDV